MSQRRGLSSKATESNQRHLRLVIEPLEQRRLLAGINVSVFVDHNATRDYQPDSDSVAAGRLVYVDSDLSGDYTLGEPVAVTDSSGNAFFGDLEAGEYSIGLITNPNFQPQVSPTRIAGTALKISDSGGDVLLSDANLENVWAVTRSGSVSQIGGQSANGANSLLAGSLVANVEFDAQHELLVLELPSGGQRIAKFNYESGQTTAMHLDGIPANAAVQQIVPSKTGFVTLWSVDGETYLSSAVRSNDVLTLSAGIPTQAEQIASPSGDVLLAATNGAHSDTLQLLDASDQFKLLFDLPISGRIDSLHANSSAALGLVELVDGGVQAVAIGPSGLSLAAILTEASGPFEFSSADGRLITGSDDPSELIVWDTATWSPVGRTTIPENTRSNGQNQLARDRRGDRVILLGNSSAHATDLSVARTERLILTDGNSITTQFGVAPAVGNTPPVARDSVQRNLSEDGVDAWDFGSDDVFEDADDDALWFSLADAPEHGELELDVDGSWIYKPHDDFAGQDTARINIHDGIDTVEVLVQIEIEAQNDPPQDIVVDVPSIPEDALVGAALGYISVIDVDAQADYHVTTSDPRFEVHSGQLVLANEGLNFEGESTIVFQVLAVDSSDPAMRISQAATVTISDVNEAPTGIHFSGNEVDENAPGAAIATVTVADEDGQANFDMTVNDPRFEVINGTLRLAEGQSLDFEDAAQVVVMVEAVDHANPLHRVTESVTISVTNRNDPPTGILLSRSEVSADLPGATVGRLEVDDPDGDSYRFTVSDDRFEVKDNTLRLIHYRHLDLKTEPSVTLSITAISPGGDSIQSQFQLQVKPHTPYQNPNIPADVDGDGEVTPVDALVLINHLNRETPTVLPPTTGGGSGEPGVAGFPDVNGDNQLTPLDILLIINYLNGNRGQGGEGESLSTSSASPPVYGPQLPPNFAGDIHGDLNDAQRKKIDAELESLLDQLSGDHNRF